MASTNEVKYILSLKDLMTAQIKTAVGETERLNKEVDGLGSKLGGLAGIAGTAFAAFGIANLGSAVMEVGQQFENAEMGLTTLLKSGDKAREVFDQIKKDAASTPFDVKSLLDANRALISAGENSKGARETVLALGDAIAASGGGNDEFQRMTANLQQIKNTGRATAADIKQFGMAGINIYQALADATGKTVNEVKDMDVSYDMLKFALMKAGAAGGIFENGMSNAMNTVTGQISNMNDVWDAAKNDIFVAMKPTILSLISVASQFFAGIGAGVKFIQQHKDAIISVGIAVAGLTLAYNMNNIIAGVLAIKTSFLTVGTLAHTVATIASITATEGLTAGMLALNIALSANPIGLVVAALALLTAGVVYAYNKFEGFRRVLNSIGSAIINFVVSPFKDAYHAVMAVFDAISGNSAGAKSHLAEIGKAMNSWNTGDLKRNVVVGVSKAKKAIEMPESVKNEMAAQGVKKVSSPRSSASNVTGTRPTNVYITIGKMIENQQIRVENATKDFEAKVYESVSKVLLNVVNDANRIATQ